MDFEDGCDDTVGFQRKSQRYSLDMNHGFVKSIVKNQLDRDEYDQQMKAKEAALKKCKKLFKRSLNPRRSNKPDILHYVPPHRKLINNDNDSDSADNGANTNANLSANSNATTAELECANSTANTSSNANSCANASSCSNAINLRANANSFANGNSYANANSEEDNASFTRDASQMNSLSNRQQEEIVTNCSSESDRSQLNRVNSISKRLKRPEMVHYVPPHRKRLSQEDPEKP